MEHTELTCDTGLEHGIIDREVFERELVLCGKLAMENNGACGWGKCENCGVIPLLYKLHKGQLLEDPDEINQAKEKVFKTL